jgi:hypothetical protein
MDSQIINYRIIGIDIVDKSMSAVPKDLKGGDVQFFFDIRVEVKVSVENKLVVPFVHIKVREGESNLALATIGVSCHFEIQDFEAHIKLNEAGLYAIPPILETSLKQIAISTARGVLYSELKGTYLNNAVLPIISVASLKKEG